MFDTHRSLCALFATASLALFAHPSGSSAEEGAPQFDAGVVAMDAALHDRLPASIKEAKLLTIGSDTSYAPWEYIMEDGRTPEGIDVDLASAIGRKLGVEVRFQTAQFDAILPALGAKYDLGVSAFSITNERMKAVNFVGYAQTGSLWGVRGGNPSGFDPANPCGTAVAIQNETSQHKLLKGVSEQCVKDGKKAIEMIPFATQAEALTRVAAGAIDATVSGSATLGYAAKQSAGRIETMVPTGSLGELGLNGIAVAKKDMALTELIADTVNALIEDGTYGRIYGMWG